MKTSSQYLLKRQPLLFDPQLAATPQIGLNGAIILQQIEYWLNLPSAHLHDGRRWIYNTYESWREQFPFWSVDTIKRSILKLEELGVLLTANYNRAGFDRTKWYSIDYDKLDEVGGSDPPSMGEHVPDHGGNLTRRSGQSDPTHDPNLPRPIPETTQRLTTETTPEIPETSSQGNVIVMHTTEGEGTIFGTPVRIDPSVPDSVVVLAPSPPSSAPPPSPFEIWHTVCTLLSWDPKIDTAVSCRKVKELDKAGVTIADMVGCAKWLEDDPFWSRGGVDMKLVASQMAKYKNRKPPRPRSVQSEYEDTVRDLREVFGEGV